MKKSLNYCNFIIQSTDIFRFFFSETSEVINTDDQMVDFTPKDTLVINTLFHFMLEETDTADITSIISKNGYARIIFSKLLSALKIKYDTKQYKKSPIINLLNYIDQHYSENITLTQLSEKFFYSPQYLSHEFKKHCGKGIKEYVIGKRISVAEEFLTQTNMSIDDIRETIGFSDKTRFFKEFQKIYGCTPSKYRKR